MKYFLPAHQGRACENLLAQCFVKPGDVVPMNYHLQRLRHIVKNGGRVVELVSEWAWFRIIWIHSKEILIWKS